MKAKNIVVILKASGKEVQRIVIQVQWQATGWKHEFLTKSLPESQLRKMIPDYVVAAIVKDLDLEKVNGSVGDLEWESQ